jgi:hypothetical protein
LGTGCGQRQAADRIAAPRPNAAAGGQRRPIIASLQLFASECISSGFKSPIDRLNRRSELPTPSADARPDGKTAVISSRAAGSVSTIKIPCYKNTETLNPPLLRPQLLVANAWENRTQLFGRRRLIA